MKGKVYIKAHTSLEIYPQAVAFPSKKITTHPLHSSLLAASPLPGGMIANDIHPTAYEVRLSRAHIIM